MRVCSHEPHLIVDGKYKINIFNAYAYEYLISKLKSSSKVLDIGCGDGDFTLGVATHNVEMVTGIDIAKKAILQANAKLSSSNLTNCIFISGDILSLKIEDSFDFIVLNDVVEHLSDAELRVLLGRVYLLLDDKGEMIIHTPNGLALCNDTGTNLIQKIYRMYLRLFKGWRGHERTVNQLYYDQVHINVQTYAQLKKKVRDCGFRSKVFYDFKSKVPFLNQLSSSMMIIARKY